MTRNTSTRTHKIKARRGDQHQRETRLTKFVGILGKRPTKAASQARPPHPALEPGPFPPASRPASQVYFQNPHYKQHSQTTSAKTKTIGLMELAIKSAVKSLAVRCVWYVRACVCPSMSSVQVLRPRAREHALSLCLSLPPSNPIPSGRKARQVSSLRLRPMPLW